MVEIHFLNVGHGDCAIIKFPSGRIAMIDINDSNVLDEESKAELTEYEKSQSQISALYTALYPLGISGQISLKSYEDLLVDPVDYFAKKFPQQSIFRFIATHPDMDHLSGLYRLTDIFKIPIWNFWDTRHEKEFSPEDFEGQKYDYKDWLKYKHLRDGGGGITVLKLRTGAKNIYYEEDGIEIWTPNEHLEQLAGNNDDQNHLSYVLHIKHGKNNIILGGDATQEVWSHLHENFNGIFPKISLLKASHHGRKNGYHQPSVEAMSPTFTIVSVGKKPKTDASDLYGQYSGGVFSTRFHGTIVAKCWLDGTIWLYDHQGNRLDLQK